MTKKDLKKITSGTLKELKFLLPVFFVASVAGVFIEQYLPDGAFELVVGENIFWAIPLAVIVGIIFPIPRYATYPIAFALFLKGVGYGIIFALISGEVIGESVVRDIIELKYLGWKFFVARFVFSVIFISLGGFAIEWIL